MTRRTNLSVVSTGDDNNENFIGVTEAARFLDSTSKGIYGMVSRREIPFRKRGRKLLFLRSELREHLNKTRMPPLGDADAGGEETKEG